jgi:hypothetical protein
VLNVYLSWERNSEFVLRRKEWRINPGNWKRCIYSRERQQLYILSILEKGKGVSNLGMGNCVSINGKETMYPSL